MSRHWNSVGLEEFPPPFSVADHARSEVECDDQGKGVLRAARKDAGPGRQEGITNVRGQAQGTRRDDVPERGRQTRPGRRDVGPAVDQPRSRQSEDISREDFEDRDELGRDVPYGLVLAEEPEREAREADQ